ncbi:hypothetical protein GGX14DRAFT_620951 [Mycena pura]|uniref:Fungal calcium binding protein domain-containing protein n=1 Tax=Mycena pura TaxID=153505 RepID=A0AAD6VKR9_9AGAR|nr:hypothetical protein GGX14DRAFT_620951 [Mycena pura]
MQFSLVALVALFAAGAAAAPAPLFLRDGTCDIKTCVLALAPTVVGCGSAAAQLGADPVSDAGCLISAATDVNSFPASCDGCAEQFGVSDAISSAAGDVESAAGDVAGDVESGVSDLGNDISGLF